MFIPTNVAMELQFTMRQLNLYNVLLSMNNQDPLIINYILKFCNLKMKTYSRKMKRIWTLLIKTKSISKIINKLLFLNNNKLLILYY